jgi:hypothetical protein
MKIYQLVAAMVLRVGSENMRPLSWSELGSVFEVTKDVIRHRITRFKEKYNIVDSDVLDYEWNRNFINDHTPEIEKDDINACDIIPGDEIELGDSTKICVGVDGSFVYIDSNDQVVLEYPENNKPLQAKNKTTAIKVEKSKVMSLDVPITEELKYLITPAVLVVVRNGQPLSIDKSHKNFEKIQLALESKSWQEVLDFIDMKNTITKYSNGRVKVENQSVIFDGNKVKGNIASRLLNCLTEENLEGLDAISNFLQRCDENPDFRVVSRLYDFIAHNDLRLDKDGFILAYKVVRKDYLDKHSGTMSNAPGLTVKMKRNLVNPKDEETCSHGLHVCAKGYLKTFGGSGDKVVLCKVDPKDFVSIPTDYNDMKARVCEYFVIKDITENFTEVVGVEA